MRGMLKEHISAEAVANLASSTECHQILPQATAQTSARKAEIIKKTITILIATNHEFVRNAFASYLRESADLKLVSNVKTVEDTLVAVLNEKPDIAILTVYLAGKFSFDIAKQIKEHCPQLKIAFLSGFFRDSWIRQALALEAVGCLTEDEPGEAVVRAIRQIASGGRYFSAQVKTRIVIGEEVRLADGLKTPIDMLTARELEMLQYIAWGKSKKEIAKILELSLNTINRHATNLMTKLGIHDRLQLARFAIHEGLIEA